MIKYTPSSERTLALFETPFEQKLSPKNRWVKMAELAPWDEMAKVFFACLSEAQGRPTVDLRIILGALLIKHIEDLSDEDTIDYIQENIYAQYFVGLSSFTIEPVFVPSLFVEIRKRLGQEGSAKLNDLVIGQARKLQAIKHRRKASKNKTTKPPQEDGGSAEAQEQGPEKEASKGNQGVLLLDATVGLYSGHEGQWSKKPRTYRREAQRAFVSFSKTKRKDKRLIRKATGQQLRYLGRNLRTLNNMLDILKDKGVTACWNAKEWHQFWIVQELYRQQEEMYRDRRRRINDRLVSLHQPHARPIKRGKEGRKETEFGPKINASLTEGFARADQIDFNAFNEANYLENQIESFKRLYGYYPALVLADQIYWTRSNRKYLKDREIEMGGAPMGPSREMSKYEKSRERKRNNKRSEIEGKFGQAKMKYGLEDLKTRLPQTIKAQINLILLAINLLKMKKVIFEPIFSLLFALIGFLEWGQKQEMKHSGKTDGKISGQWTWNHPKTPAWNWSF